MAAKIRQLLTNKAGDMCLHIYIHKWAKVCTCEGGSENCMAKSQTSSCDLTSSMQKNKKIFIFFSKYFLQDFDFNNKKASAIA